VLVLLMGFIDWLIKIIIQVRIMDILFGTLGFGIQLVFLLKREWLFEKRSFTLIVAVSIVLFALSYILMFVNMGNPSVVRLMTLPLLSAGMFYMLNFVFFKIYNRNPEDTFWSMDWSQMRDGIFNFLFWVLGIMIPVVITYELLP
jgi:hypothetical protein